MLTLPATGSEMNPASVITHVEKGAKLPFMSPHCYPVFSILDPELTYTPVSYTHLDVYKRQKCCKSWFRRASALPPENWAV